MNIVVLTGAGISAESGIKTFRGTDGLWEGHRIEDVATPEGFERDPEVIHCFYNQRRAMLQTDVVKPNLAHHALVELERANPSTLIVTQNIDDLHERAGSQNLIHMHGELLKMRCSYTGDVVPFTHAFEAEQSCPICRRLHCFRPHIVWFGEMPLQMDEIADALAQCDLFISIGTSGNVYPAAGFVQQAKHNGAHTVEINLEPSIGHTEFAQTHYGKATEMVPEFVQQIIKQLRDN